MLACLASLSLLMSWQHAQCTHSHTHTRKNARAHQPTCPPACTYRQPCTCMHRRRRPLGHSRTPIHTYIYIYMHTVCIHIHYTHIWYRRRPLGHYSRRFAHIHTVYTTHILLLTTKPPICTVLYTVYIIYTYRYTLYCYTYIWYRGALLTTNPPICAVLCPWVPTTHFSGGTPRAQFEKKSRWNDSA